MAGVARRRVLVLCALALSLLMPARAEGDGGRPEGVDEYMTYHLGRWESETSYFDRNGKVVRTLVEGYGEKVLIEGQVNLHYTYNSSGSVSTAFRFYSPRDDKLYMIDVTSKGDWWVLYGERGSETFYSHEKELDGGRRMIFRFTHTNVNPDAFDSIVEMSFDHGETWRKYSHQRYRKIGDGFER